MKLVVTSVWLLYTCSLASSFATTTTTTTGLQQQQQLFHWYVQQQSYSGGRSWGVNLKVAPPAVSVRGGGGGGGRSSSSSSLSAAASVEETDDIASMASTPPVSLENLSLLSDRGRQAVERLIAFDKGMGAQTHVYGNWPEAGIEDEGKQHLAEQVRINFCC